MADIQAVVVITVLIWVAVSVSGTTTELSTTAGDTVNIPCHFGEGTVKSIFWYFKYCTGGPKILFYVGEKLTFGAEYANRTSLQKDNSTLILRNITVADEGTYCCDVDRQGQIAVTNINTKLNVFSLRPDTLPKITPCSQADESSSCIIRRNQSFTLTCTLPNVYPVEDTELIWYQDGKRVLSTDNITQNDDGTTDINRQIQVSKTGNFTCNATYLTANERENTAVSVEACIIPLASLRPDTLPKITPCSRVDESSSCIVHRNQSFTLTCTLPNVCPVEDTELIWYQEGKRVLSTDNITQNDDGTTDISRQIQVSKTGNFTCNATYISANGRVNTAVSVEACIIPPANATNTTDKNLTDGAIVGIALSVATVLIVGILLCTCCLKKRSKCCFKKDEQKSKVIQPNPEELTPLKKSAKDASKEGNDSSKPTERPTAAAEEGDNSTLSPSPTVAHGGNVNRSDQRRIKDEEIMTLSTLMLHNNFTDFCLALGFSITDSENITAKHQLNYNAAFRDILNKWSTQKGGFIRDLDKALVEANSGGLIDDYKI